MGAKLLANKYIELNIQDIKDVYNNFKDENLTNSEYYTFIYCREGMAVVFLDDKEKVLNPGMLLLILPHHNYVIKKGIYNVIMITYGGAAVDELIIDSPFINSNIVQSDDNNQIGYYFYKLVYSYNKSQSANLKCLGILYEIFFELTKYCQTNEDNLINSERHIEVAKQYINQNYHHAISIVDVAKNVGVTSNYLANIFQHHLHTTPKKYLTKVRMEQAKRLLLTKKYKVKEVGNLVGYQNQLHFSGEFKKYTSLSPLDFQRENKESA